MATRKLEEQMIEKGYLKVVGVDEAGRGSLAGPVVVAACYLPSDFDLPLKDSKKLSPKRRETLYQELIKYPGVEYAWSQIGVKTIDRLNILQATLKGMSRAVRRIGKVDCALIDGNQLPQIKGVDCLKVIKGDQTSLNIAGASIIAKVTRDRMMVEYNEIYPGWGFDVNKGYYCHGHGELVIERGKGSPIHRRSFAPLKNII